MNHCMKILVLFLFITSIFFILLLGVGLVNAKTIFVDDDVGADHTSIQEAIDDSDDDDQIIVHSGIYFENIIVHRSVKLIGNRSSNTIIVGGDADFVMKISANFVTVSGMTITGNYPTCDGIRVESNDNTITEVTCKKLKGDGIKLVNAENNSFYKCESLYNDGNGIQLFSSNSNKFSGCIFEYNHINGMTINDSQTNMIWRTSCSNNSFNGLHFLESAGNTATLNVIENNNFGIVLSNSSHENELYENNASSNRKDGIFIFKSNSTYIDWNIISQNSANGISITYSENTSLIKNFLTWNNIGILVQNESRDTLVYDNHIENNYDFGIYALDNSGNMVNAFYNYWGDDSGPYHPENNTQGKGNQVSDFVNFVPWMGNIPPQADFIVSSFYDPGVPITDTNDGIENEIIDVFYRDKIQFQQKSSDPDGDLLTYEWIFHCDETKFETQVLGETVDGIVGIDFLYPGLDYDDPIVPDDEMDYTVTLCVTDGRDVSEKSYTVRVHPFAEYTFVKQVIMGATILEASVKLVWRGFRDEVAPAAQYISPDDRPVFVFIDEKATSPDLSLKNRGGIGNVYDIEAIGCYLQNGEEGFIEAEIELPILTSDLQELGDSYVLQEDLRLERYDSAEKRFVVVEGSHVESESGIKYVVGMVDHFTIFAAIVDSIYTGDPSVQPDLSLFSIEFSRSPILDGQEVEVRTIIKNYGKINAWNVDVRIYDGDDLVGDLSIDEVRSSGEEALAKQVFPVVMLDSNQQFEDHYISVYVNKQRTIDEGSGNYGNNEKTELLIVTSSHAEKEDEWVVDELMNIPFGLYLLMTLLVILFGTLIIVVRTPDGYFQKDRAHISTIGYTKGSVVSTADRSTEISTKRSYEDYPSDNIFDAQYLDIPSPKRKRDSRISFIAETRKLGIVLYIISIVGIIVCLFTPWFIVTYENDAESEYHYLDFNDSFKTKFGSEMDSHFHGTARTVLVGFILLLFISVIIGIQGYHGKIYSLIEPFLPSSLKSHPNHSDFLKIALAMILLVITVIIITSATRFIGYSGSSSPTDLHDEEFDIRTPAGWIIFIIGLVLLYIELYYVRSILSFHFQQTKGSYRKKVHTLIAYLMHFFIAALMVFSLLPFIILEDDGNIFDGKFYNDSAIQVSSEREEGDQFADVNSDLNWMRFCLWGGFLISLIVFVGIAYSYFSPNGYEQFHHFVFFGVFSLFLGIIFFLFQILLFYHIGEMGTVFDYYSVSFGFNYLPLICVIGVFILGGYYLKETYTLSLKRLLGAPESQKYW